MAKPYSNYYSPRATRPPVYPPVLSGGINRRADQRPAAPIDNAFKYIGRTVQLNYDTGDIFNVAYLTENALRWTSLSAETGEPIEVQDETYYQNRQAEELFTVNWIEADGTSVMQNLDFARMRVYAFLSWNDPAARGGRATLARTGTMRFV